MSKPKPAPVVDERLAQWMVGERDPMEKLAADQSKAIAARLPTREHTDVLTTKGRLVILECGHYAVTRARYRCACARCGEMIRAGYDYEAFRMRGAGDDFSWPDDPLRLLHEREESPVQHWLSSNTP